MATNYCSIYNLQQPAARLHFLYITTNSTVLSHPHTIMDMDMSTTTTSAMGMSTTTTATTSTSTTDPTTMQMSTVFFASTTTPLYSTAWSPTSPSTYAATCLFLILLALALRLLYAVHANLESIWLRRARSLREIVVAGEDAAEGVSAVRSQEKQLDARSDGPGDETTRLMREQLGKGRRVQPWRLSVDLPRACLVTVMAGVGYLLCVY